jgi:hypothetical protein
MCNPSIIHRRRDPIHRSGCRNRSVESSRNHQIDSPVDRPSGPRNHELIVNQFHVIVNSAAWNLSPIHHQNAGIYHSKTALQSPNSWLSSRTNVRDLRFLAALEMTDWIRLGSFAIATQSSGLEAPSVSFSESSDNHPMNSGNHPTDSANLPTIYRFSPAIYPLACDSGKGKVGERG